MEFCCLSSEAKQRLGVCIQNAILTSSCFTLINIRGSLRLISYGPTPNGIRFPARAHLAHTGALIDFTLEEFACACID